MNHMKIKYLILLGGLLLLVSVVLNYGAYQRRHVHNWVPLSEPISLQVGTITTKEFVTDIDDWFQINLEVERNIEFDRLNCLLGVRNDYCTDIKSVVAINWFVISNSTIIFTKVNQALIMGHIGVELSEEQLVDLKLRLVAHTGLNWKYYRMVMNLKGHTPK